jgi:EmrB/QacA subfamily drug resistance transporter
VRARRIDQRIVVAVVYVASMLLNSLNGSIINVAIATLARQFDVSPAATQGVIVGYLVSVAVFIPASGWLGDRWGTKRTFTLALALFTGAWRARGVLPGPGGALLTPVGMSLLYRAFPPEERVRISRLLMFPTIVGPASGPILGGFVVQYLSWHWAFFITVPVGLTALIFGTLCLNEHREEHAGAFDLPGFALSALGFALAMYALTEGPTRGWLSPGIAISGVLGLALLAAFIRVELRSPAPLVDLRLLGNRLFRSTLNVSFFSTAGFSGVLFLVPLFLQEARGVSPLESGLTSFPEALGVVVSTQLVARLYPRFGPRRLMAGGLSGMAVITIILGLVGITSGPWPIRVLMFLLGVGMAYIFLPNQAASFATITSAQTGHASTLSSAQRQIGSALGVALLSGVLAAIGPTLLVDGVVAPNLMAYRAAFFAAAVLALVGVLLALRVPDEDAAATMRPRPARPIPARPATAEAD